MILNPFESFPSNHSIENSNLVKRIGYGLKFANIVRSFKKWFENCMFETSESHEEIHGFVVLNKSIYPIQMKFSKDSYWFRSGMFSLLQNVFSMVFGFGGFYLLVRLIDKPHMGSYTLFVTVTSMVEVARVGFIKYGFIKLRAEAQEDEHPKIFMAALTLNLFALLVSLCF